MDRMFFNAASLKHKLCGAAWVHSKASKDLMFAGSPGSISQTVCEGTDTDTDTEEGETDTGADTDTGTGTDADTDALLQYYIFKGASTASTRKYVKRRPLPDRELIVRTPTTTLVSTPTLISMIANTVTCLKCGTFKKSGRVSCCAPDGAWDKNCGGVGNKRVGHSWSEGAQACKCKSNISSM